MMKSALARLSAKVNKMEDFDLNDQELVKSIRVTYQTILDVHDEKYGSKT